MPAQGKFDWRAPLTNLHGVGPKLAEKLAKLGLTQIVHVLFHFPLRYQDKTQITPIGALQAGQEALVKGEVLHSEVAFRGRRTLLCRLNDGTGQLTLRFFYFNKSQQQSFTPGSIVQCFGQARTGYSGLEFVHPEYRILQEDEDLLKQQSITAIYPTIEGISQGILSKISDQVLSLLKSQPIDDVIPANLIADLGFDSLSDSLYQIHRPEPNNELFNDIQRLKDKNHPAQQRLAFEELLAHQLAMRLKQHERQFKQAPKLQTKTDLQQRCIAQLPFDLTNAQQKVVTQINQDLQKNHPALRLIQGDVGSGKTIVALLAALPIIENHYQVAVMAPTELLARQHYEKFAEWLTPLEIPVAYLSGSTKDKDRKKILAALEGNRIPIIVGTHALFQDDIKFHALAMLVVDEQHRFGVDQRLALRNKGVDETTSPHQITLTATPIPRTLAMTMYADMDYSIIDELPPGRSPIKTVVIAQDKRTDIIDRVRHACSEGRQVYWVCPLITESEVLQCEAAEDTYALLSEQLAGISVGLVHGRMKAKDKEKIMQAFKANDVQVLVATTVIEVGVDVPNASLMMIENAERLGLAQLHQLRGRVGRGETKSSCVLMYKSPLSQKAKKRLDIMRNTQDGFKIAEEDLKMRGAGELFGTRQTGDNGFRVADIFRDMKLLPKVEELADFMHEQQPYESKRLIHRWLGLRQQYHQA